MNKETKRSMIFYGIGIPTTLILFYISIFAGFSFIIGVCIGSIIEKSGWNDSHLKNKN